MQKLRVAASLRFRLGTTVREPQEAPSIRSFTPIPQAKVSRVIPSRTMTCSELTPSLPSANTATLIENSNGAYVLGASRTINLSDGTPTTVKAAASCGFDSGFNQRGYCDKIQYVGSSTDTYFSSGSVP